MLYSSPDRNCSILTLKRQTSVAGVVAGTEAGNSHIYKCKHEAESKLEVDEGLLLPNPSSSKSTPSNPS